jgi:fused signal recognition particle receptor
MVTVIVLVAVAVLLLGSATLVTLTRSRRRGVELEPPPVKRIGRTESPRAGRVVPEAPPELTPEQLAEIEDALTQVEGSAPPVEAEAVEAESAPPAVKPRFRDRLGKARSLFAGYLSSVRSRGRIDEETWEELEEALIRADVGIDTTTVVLEDLRSRVKRDAISDPEELLTALKGDLIERLAGERSLRHEAGGPNVWLFVGVNGVGKTTTIGKIGLREAAAGRSVVMAAGDTFRAAAADQLELWAKRVGADLVRGSEGADPGAVVFDAVERAAARKADLVLADTAGRLHTKVNLMEELKKVHRVAGRPPARLSEVLLVIDATTGQNGLVQAKEFAAAVGVTGVVLTKLDGTAKGGIALAIEAELGIPIKLVGLGESAEDLVDFDPDEFVDALFT